jgi:hypothetical protein
LSRIGSEPPLPVKENDIRCAEIRVIESIEHLDPELSVDSFAEAEGLEEREVKIGNSRACQSIAPGIAERICRWTK